MSFVSSFDALHEQAMKASGFDDFGTTDYVEPLKLLLADYDEYNQFTELGVQLVNGWTVTSLIGRLFSQQGFKTHPQFAAAPVTRPLIILGLVRTGSTALLKLLAADPQHQTIPYWLGNTPMPRPPRETWEANPWYQATAAGLKMFYDINPEMWKIHPMFPDQADECRIVIDHTFWSSGLSTTATVPNYTDWAITADARYAYQYHRKVLGLMAGGDARRWVLKDPSHIFGLDSLLKIYPDACIVFTHRDITTSMASGAKLLWEIRKMRDAKMDLKKHGAEQLAIWGRVLDKTEKVRKQHNPAQFFDVHVNQLHTDPLGTVEAIYRQFDIPMSDDSRQALKKHIRGDVRAGHAHHVYSAEQFGLTTEAIHQSIGAYSERAMEMDRRYGKGVA